MVNVTNLILLWPYPTQNLIKISYGLKIVKNFYLGIGLGMFFWKTATIETIEGVTENALKNKNIIMSIDLAGFYKIKKINFGFKIGYM